MTVMVTVMAENGTSERERERGYKMVRALTMNVQQCIGWAIQCKTRKYIVQMPFCRYVRYHRVVVTGHYNAGPLGVH